MHAMRTIATRSAVYLLVCLPITRLRPAKTAARIEVLCGTKEDFFGHKVRCVRGSRLPTGGEGNGGKFCLQCSIKRGDSMRLSPDYFGLHLLVYVTLYDTR